MTTASAHSPLATASRWLIASLLLLVPLTPPHAHGVFLKPLVFELLAVGAAACAILAALRARMQVHLLAPATLGFGALLLAAGLALPGAVVPDAALRGLLFPAGMLAVHIAVLLVIDRPSRFAVLIGVFLIGAAVVSAFGLAGFLEFRASQATEAERSQWLATPFFEHSYLAIQAIVPVLPVAIGLAIGARFWQRIALALLSVPLLLFLAVVLSRAALLAVTCGTAVVLLGLLAHRLALRRGGVARSLRKIAAIGSAAIVVVAFACHFGLFGEAARALTLRFTSLFDPRLVGFNFSRLLVWADALRMAADHWPLGIGAGNFGYVFGNYHEGLRPISHAHNQFIHTLAELGPLGLLGLLLAFSQSLSAALTAVLRPRLDGAHTAALLGTAGGLVTLLVYGCVESPIQFPASAALLAILAGAAVRLAAPGGGYNRHPAQLPLGRHRLALAGAVTLLAIAVGAALPATLRHQRAGYLGYQATLALGAGDAALASHLADLAVTTAPAHPEVRLIQATVTRLAGDTARATVLYHDLEQLYPGLTEVRWNEGAGLVFLNRLEAAVEPLLDARARAAPEARPAITSVLADCMFRMRRFEAARLLYLDLLRQNYQGHEPVLLRRLAETLLNLGRDRPLAVALLNRHIARVSELDARYSHELLDKIDNYYPPALSSD